jgi:sugar phosphate isomerase/epimerase
MERKFSLAHLTVAQCSVPELVNIAGMAGYDYISPRIVDLAAQPGLIALTKKALEDTGVGIHDVELNIYKDTTDMRIYVPALAIGAELGAKYILSSLWADEMDQFAPIERFGELCELAADFNMGVRLEFVTWSSVRDLGQAQQAIRYVNRPNAGYIVDMLHAHYSRLHPQELACAWEGCLSFVHLCDAPQKLPGAVEEMMRIGYGARDYPGEGGINIVAYMMHIPQDAVCCIEAPNHAKAAALGHAEHARRCLASAKKYLAKQGV